MKIKLTIVLLIVTFHLAAQNIGIGHTNPVAPLDVSGSVLFRGVNSNLPPSPMAAVEFFMGRGANGGLPTGVTQADLAFSYGGPGGGFRHFITSRHDIFPNSAGNAIDFYINNSMGALNSTAPGIGNLRMFSVTANGVKIDSNFTLEFGEGIADKEINAGKIGYRTFSGDALDIVGAGPDGNNRKIRFFSEGGAIFNGKVAVGSSVTGTEKLYVNGDGKFDGNLSTATNFISGGNMTVYGSILAGSNITTNANLTVNGSLNAGLQYLMEDVLIDGNKIQLKTMGCPSGYKVVSGGGGHRDFNTAASDIVMNYSGPDLATPLTAWRLIYTNTSSSSRTIRMYVICSRLQ